jgi:hypothetical protein
MPAPANHGGRACIDEQWRWIDMKYEQIVMA